MHFDFGDVLFAAGQHDRAIEQYRQAIELMPGLAAAHFSLGNALAGQGRIEEAEVCLRRAVELKPDSAAFHSNWVMCQQYREGVTPEKLAAAHAEWDRRHGVPLRDAWCDQGRVREAMPLAGGALRTEQSNEVTAEQSEDGIAQRTFPERVPCSTHPTAPSLPAPSSLPETALTPGLA